ncbi:MAG: DNA alkylation repair protein [Planctomycetales bacterium]|nr:DNA alkylation repair protein [Planctomycetales bacterium]
MNRPELHPAQQFSAPSAILPGQPLKNLLDGKLVRLIGESLAAVVPDFDAALFQRQATRGLTRLELKERASRIAEAMTEQLPESPTQLVPLFVRSLGPKLVTTEGNGLAVFFYMPHSQLVADHGPRHFEAGMRANHELTQRFTAEFSIRPMLIAHRDRTIQRLAKWAKDSNPHVRRLVSEGTRPRLPWAMRLPELQANPELALPLLESLKDDRELYVRRSVANHLGDIAKDHLEWVCEICVAWLDEANGMQDDEAAANRRWLIRHALRHPAKKGDAAALALRAQAGAKQCG